jgi:SPFH domain / Band 7 family
MLVNQKGSGTQAIVGIIILIIGIGVGQILRLGKYQRQVGPGIQKRIPFADNVLVVDIREKVREFKAERMLTKDNIPVTIDAILRYKIIETKSKDALLNVENFNEMIQKFPKQPCVIILVLLYFKMYCQREKRLIKILNPLFQK